MSTQSEGRPMRSYDEFVQTYGRGPSYADVFGPVPTERRSRVRAVREWIALKLAPWLG